MIVGYTYKAQNLCPGCTLEAMSDSEPPDENCNPERVLSFVAGILGYNRMDEDSFDSGEFPKVIDDHMIQACVACVDEGYPAKHCSNNLCDNCQREMM